jgi:voltage-gated potassium channel
MTATKEANFTFLLLGLMATLLAGPILLEFTDQAPSLIISIGFTLTLVIGVWSLIDSKTWFRFGLLLATSELVLTIINALRPESTLHYLTMGIAIAFCSLSLWFALHHIFAGHRIDGNRIIGAVCAYLLLGILLSILNMFVYELLPGSFQGMPDAVDTERGLDIIYYSFVTMTTLGYGDISPTGPLAKALAYFGAISGQFYIAILVGMAVGQFLNQRNARE